MGEEIVEEEGGWVGGWVTLRTPAVDMHTFGGMAEVEETLLLLVEDLLSLLYIGVGG